MRIYSIHPKYLDSKGLVALWREGLLAKHVLEGKTVGYLNHPQLNRFRQAQEPLSAINLYLSFVYDEAKNREFSFKKDKFIKPTTAIVMPLNRGQLEYEFQHLMKKLAKRDYNTYLRIKDAKTIEPHPIFELVDGGIEDWEVIKHNKIY